MEEMRKCQICKKKQLLDNFYTAKKSFNGKSYICKPCTAFMSNISRFKKLIKERGIDYAKQVLVKEEITLKAKIDVLLGISINNACKRNIGDFGNENKN